jgi:hypothetical protein
VFIDNSTFTSATQSEIGIYVASSPSTIVCSNDVKGFAAGLYFDGTELGSTVSTNNILSNGFANATGMYISSTGQIGNQGSGTQPNNNQWLGAFACSTNDLSSPLTKFFVQGPNTVGNTYNPSWYGACTKPTVAYGITGSATGCATPPPIIKPGGAVTEDGLNGNTSISSTSLDRYEQTVTDIYVANMASKTGKLTMEQLSVLRAIAVKCPFEDGVSVYRARSILASYDGLLKYSNTCESVLNTVYSGEPNQVQNITDPVQVNIYPNPNRGTFTLEYKLAEGQSGRVAIYNTMGSVVGEYDLNDSEGKMTITNTDLADGIYIYKLSVNDQIQKVGKIIIIR